MVQRLHRATPPITCRDIKPENLIACPDGKYRIIDLDTTRYIKEDTQHDTTLLGTEENTAPEKYGYHQSYKRTDVYALGMLLLFLSSGGYDKNVDLPKDIRKIVNRYTEFYPYLRYTDAAALQRALLGRSSTAKAGFAVSFAAAGAAIALAVTLCLPKPSDLNDSAPIISVPDNSNPDITDMTTPNTSEPTVPKADLQSDETATDTEITPPAPVISPEGNVVFAEPRIERAVRLNLGLSDSDTIGEDELKRVTSIVLYGDRDFKSFIEYQQFIWNGGWMENQYIPYVEEPLDLSDLTLFENLKALAVIKQNADTLPDLTNSATLRQCVIKYCSIEDISGLRNCTELETLDLSCTPLYDISPLKDLKKLTSIDVSNTYVEDISAIEGSALTNLGTGRYTQVSPQTLASFPELVRLNLRNVDEKLLAEIKNLKKLESLMIWDGVFKDMTAFSDMKTLTELQIGDSNKFVSMEGVQSLKKLSLINVSSTSLSELPADLSLPQLEHINLSNTAVTDFTPLLNCHNLQQVLVSEEMLENAQAQLGAAEKEINIEIS
ncbi:MAG: hypothetical protein J6A19_10405 [Oscillospiraceae bacterium]|nr:hypothetical protein [Oscillospiraceae bacterium]